MRCLAGFPDAAELLEALQLQGDQGPWVDCVHSGQLVRSGNLAAEISRWPRWPPGAVRAGIRSVYGTPLRSEDTVIGALSLFGVDVDGTSEDDLLILQALADVATITVLAQRHTERAAALNTQLRSALTTRVRIEQAKGSSRTP